MHTGTRINAGVMLVRPSAGVFALLRADVGRSDPSWHRASYGDVATRCLETVGGKRTGACECDTWALAFLFWTRHFGFGD